MNTADDNILLKVKALFESHKNEDDDFYNGLPKEVQDLLMESREQAKLGKTTPHKEITAKYRKKYNVTG